MEKSSTGSFGDRIKKRRNAQIQQHFVGREQERKLFQDAITSDDTPFAILHVYGPGGIGKTALLQAFCAQCDQANIAYTYINASTIEVGNRLAFAEKLLTAAQSSKVLMLDTYELLTPLENWIRLEILPQLPGDILLVIAGRNPPSQLWMGDPGLNELTHVMLLNALSVLHSETFFTLRGLSSHSYQSALSFSSGHPLAMSLIADLLKQNPALNFNPNESPDLIRMLISRFIENAPTPEHREALELCALLRVTNEQSLMHILKQPSGNKVFEWLRDLSFIESGIGGIFPQSIARDALIADLKWRNSSWYLTLKLQAFEYLETIVFSKTKNKPVEEHDLLFLFRDHPEISPYFMWDSVLWNETMEVAEAKDYPYLLQVTTQHEGEESAKWASYWFEKQPQNVYVGRNLNTGEITGFVCIVRLTAQKLKAHTADPYFAQVAAYIKKSANGLPSGREFMAVRFWMDSDSYQHPDNFQNVLFDWITRYYLANPDLAYTFTLRANPEFWKTYTDHSDFVCLTDYAFEANNKPYALLCRDWIAVAPHEWLKNFYRKLLIETDRPIKSANATAYLELNQQDFGEAVRYALRALTDSHALRQSPLIHAHCVANFVPTHAPVAQRVKFLQDRLNEAIEKTKNSPDDRYFQVLQSTYINESSTQEEGAKTLNISLSTFRRNLITGTDKIIELLWGQEHPSR